MRIFTFCLLLCSVYSSQASAKQETAPTILASIQPLGIMAKAIVGKHGDVEVLIPAGASAHHYALSVSDRDKLASADIVLWIGEDLESFLHKPIKQRVSSKSAEGSKQSAKRTITAMELSGIEWPPINSEAHKATHTHDHSHDHGEHNPHLWLNPINYLPMVDELLKYLSDSAPMHQSYYEHNARNLKVALQQLDEQLFDKMKDFSGRAFIAAHPAYDHFVHRYSLRQLDYIALTPERSAGAKHLYQLRQQRSALCIVVDKGLPSLAAQQLSDKLAIPLIELDPLGVDVIEGINSQNAASARGALVNLIETLASSFRRCLVGNA